MNIANEPVKILLLAATLLLATACQTTETRTRTATTPPPGTNAMPVDINVALSTDACALQLQDISGAMLLYYRQHQKLPPTLDALRKFLPSMNLQTACTESKRPYTYHATPLAAPGQDRLLIMYDATPSHYGWRWGIVISPPEGDSPLRTEVIRLDEPVLRIYMQN